jgi:C-terminal peptidase prc
MNLPGGKTVFSKPSIIYSSLFLLIFAIFSCNPAQGKNVPLAFSRDDFEEIVHYTLNNYIDPSSINTSRAYIGAASAGLEALPYPLFFYPEDFFNNRKDVMLPERIMPGKVIKIDKKDPYIIFVPDYEALEKQNKTFEEKRKLSHKKMTETQMIQEGERLRKQLDEEKAAFESSWEKIPFTSEDVAKVIQWIEDNQTEYSRLPPSYKGADPFEEDPFGMNHIYFAAANGIMQTIDPHSAVIDNRTWEKIVKEASDSSFEGIGAMLRGGGNLEVVVETPLANSPSLKAGVRAGDIIRKVDGTPVDGLPLSDVVKKIRGKRDTMVVLSIERPPVRSFHEISIQRSIIDQKGVSSDYLPEQNIGYIKVTSFLFEPNHPEKSTGNMIINEFDNLQQKSGGLSGLVIDLRNNPGGYLDEAVRVSGLFIEKGSVAVQTRGRGTGLRPLRTSDRPVIPASLPVIVLINAGSASASEILASALMDHKRALIVGERSFGKASVQGMEPMGNFKIKLTTARYYAPQGYTIQASGVIPDIDISEELAGNFPPRFREEDMWKHLPRLEKRAEDSARENWVNKLKSEAANSKEADIYIEEHKNDARRTDYALIRSLPYFNAMKKYPSPK